MENTHKKKNNRVGEIIIVLMVLVCAALVVADMTTNLVEELDTQESQVIIEETGIPTPAVRPTFPPDYTPEVIIDA